MVKVKLVFVPPGVGEIESTLPIELQELPRVGDYVSLRREAEDLAAEYKCTSDFIVRKVVWNVNCSDVDTSASARCRQIGESDYIWNECEFAEGPTSSGRHRRACEMSKHQTAWYGPHEPMRKFDISI